MVEQAVGNTHTEKSGFRANRAFIVESLVLLAFLALAVALILQLFASAGLASRNAHAQSIAMQLAGNAAERFAADPHALDRPQFFDSDGQMLSEDGPASAFKVSADIEPSLTAAGRFYDAQVKVEAVGNGALEQPYIIHTARYASDDGAGIYVDNSSLDKDAVGRNAVNEEELAEGSATDSGDTSSVGVETAADNVQDATEEMGVEASEQVTAELSEAEGA